MGLLCSSARGSERASAAGITLGVVNLDRTPEQPSAIGPVVSITFAMLGGCMWPLSIVSPLMRAVGHATPQAWAVDAWTNLLSSHGTIVTIWHQLGILALLRWVSSSSRQSGPPDCSERSRPGPSWLLPARGGGHKRARHSASRVSDSRLR
jgi:hypothetical protein